MSFYDMATLIASTIAVAMGLTTMIAGLVYVKNLDK